MKTVIGVACFIVKGGNLEQSRLAVRRPLSGEFLCFVHGLLHEKGELAFLESKNREEGLASIEPHLVFG